MSTLGEMADAVQDATLRGAENRSQVKLDIQQAIYEVDALLRPQIASSVETLVANQGDYSIATDFLITNLTSIRDVIYASAAASDNWPLEPQTPQVIRELRRTASVSSFISYWALDGLDQFMVYPATQGVGDTLTIYYVPRPVALSTESDVPTGLPVEFHDIYVIAAIRRSMRQQSPEYTQMYHGLWRTRLGEYRQWANRREGSMPKRALVRGGRGLYRPHDNSTDIRSYR